jgi:pseudoazurin
MQKLFLSTALIVGSVLSASAEVIEVEMLNKNDAGERMVFGQELITADVGDTIRFVPTDKSHNAQSVRDALPEGQEAFKGRLNEAVEYVVTETGLTAVVCLPHQALGMVALVVVGDDVSNAEQILDARIPAKGGDKIESLVEEARALVSEPAANEADQNS